MRTLRFGTCQALFVQQYRISLPTCVAWSQALSIMIPPGKAHRATSLFSEFSNTLVVFSHFFVSSFYRDESDQWLGAAGQLVFPKDHRVKGVEAEFRNYQLEGVRWFWFLRAHHLHGALCDDMGLGKTLQVRLFLFLVRSSFIPFLFLFSFQFLITSPYS